MDYEKAERLAALLDGTCSDEERERLLAQLAEDDDDLEVFAAAGAALHQHEQEEALAGVIPLHPHPDQVSTRAPAPRRRPPRGWVPMAVGAGLLAAGIAALAIIPRSGSESGAVAVVSQLGNSGAALPPGFDPFPYGTRGGSGSLSDGGRVNLGASLVTLQVAGGSDPARAREAAGHIADLLDRTTAPATLRERYRSIANGSAAAHPLDPSLAKDAERVAGGKDAVRFGEWIQGARIAAAGGNAAFFRRDEAQRWLAGKGVPEPMKRSELVTQSLNRARTAVGPSTPDWVALREALEQLLSAATR